MRVNKPEANKGTEGDGTDLLGTQSNSCSPQVVLKPPASC